MPWPGTLLGGTPSGPPWAPWLTLLRALFALPMPAAEAWFAVARCQRDAAGLGGCGPFAESWLAVRRPPAPSLYLTGRRRVATASRAAAALWAAPNFLNIARNWSVSGAPWPLTEGLTARI